MMTRIVKNIALVFTLFFMSYDNILAMEDTCSLSSASKPQELPKTTIQHYLNTSFATTEENIDCIVEKAVRTLDDAVNIFLQPSASSFTYDSFLAWPRFLAEFNTAIVILQYANLVTDNKTIISKAQQQASFLALLGKEKLKDI